MNNSRLLVTTALSIVIFGFGLLWFIFSPASSQPIPSSPPVSVSTSSASPAELKRATLGVTGEKALVTKVIDGDTVELENGQKVRLVGIDTPETVDPRRPVGCFGKEASNKMKELLTGKEVVLQKDVSDTDKYDRLLRYIYLPLPDGQTLFVNDYLVREGYAHVLTYPPDIKFNEQFLVAERQARLVKRGLWSACP